MSSSALLQTLRTLLIELDRPGSYITYNTHTKLASFHDGDFAAGCPRVGVPVSSEDLLALFERAWITRYDSRDGVHRYRITETGRRAIG
jgi:hypothetical protein